ncbi:hypothetical protein LLH00_04945 [bacterium]|nr:hypothetical protein [bacterium]
MLKTMPNGLLRPLLTIAVLLMLILAPAAPLTAQEPNRCRITVLEILADKSGQGLDNELKALKKDLDKLNYTTYRLSNSYQLSTVFSQPSDLTLLGENKLTLTAEGVEDNGKIRLKVKLSPRDSKEKSIEMVTRVADGGMFLLGGPSQGDGVLILAVTVKM